MKNIGEVYRIGCVFLRLSTLVLCCMMILCCTGLIEGTAHRLRVQTGSIAAVCPLLLAAGAFSLPLGSGIWIHCGVVLLFLGSLILCRRADACAVALLFAACFGAIGFLFCRMLPDFYEQGLLLALPAAVIGALLLRHRRSALLCVVSAPLFYAACVLLEEYYLFQTVRLDLAASEVFDAQVAGAAMLFLMWRIFALLHGCRRIPISVSVEKRESG